MWFLIADVLLSGGEIVNLLEFHLKKSDNILRFRAVINFSSKIQREILNRTTFLPKIYGILNRVDLPWQIKFLILT